MVKRKKWVFVLVVILLLNMSVQSMAKESAVASVQPRYSMLGDASATLNISDQTASITAQAIGLAGVTKLSITVELQKYENKTWVAYEEWSGEKSSIRMTLEGSCKVTPGKYRIVTTFTAYKGTGSEEKVQTGTEVTCE